MSTRFAAIQSSAQRTKRNPRLVHSLSRSGLNGPPEAFLPLSTDHHDSNAQVCANQTVLTAQTCAERNSEFRYEGPPISSLQGLDPNVVFYIGTFSKILSPALRIGYLVLPCPLIEQCRTLKWFSDLHTPSLEQLVLARFIEGRDTLKRFLRENFGDNVKVTGGTTGLHLIGSALILFFLMPSPKQDSPLFIY